MEITGIKLRNSYQIYFVDVNSLFVKKNALCIAETEHGVDIGRVIKCTRFQRSRISGPSGKLLRKATQEDLKLIPEIEAVEKKAFSVCRDKAKEKRLDMKLVSVKCLFDKTKIIFYFVAENRIDFRELVRDLAAVFRTRIEMRQIGVRDESRIVGGYGPCGRPLCCCHLKQEFDPVSIKMAKEQNLNLNSLKISGMCGRLLCCLGYEYEVYRELYDNLPKVGTEIMVGPKPYTVDSLDGLKETVRLKSGDHVFDVHRRDLDFAGGKYSISSETMKRIFDTVDESGDV